MRLTRFILLVATLACGNARAEFELANGIAAIANESIITVQDVNQASAATVESYRRSFYNRPDIFDRKRISAMTDALDQLIDKQLVLDDFKNLGGIIHEGYIDDAIRERIRDQFGDRVTLTKTLQAQGITYETFRQRERERIINIMMERKNVREALLISPAKIERYYQTNQVQYKLGDQVKLRVIVLNRAPVSSADEVRQMAVEIKSKIDAGAAFQEMAATYSEGSERRDGGLWGWKEQKALRKGLWEVASGLNTNECSPIIAMSGTTTNGIYWIYRGDKSGKLASARKFNEREQDVFVEEKLFPNGATMDEMPAAPVVFYLMRVDEKQVAHTRPLQEVRDDIEKDLLLQERARLQRRWIERLRGKSFFRYF